MFSKKISLVYSSAMMDPHHRLRLAQQLIQLDADQNDVVQQQQQQQALRRQRRGASHRRWWCQPWLLRRPAFGQFEQLMVEIKVEDPAAFQNFVRFVTAMFQELVDRHTTNHQDRHQLPQSFGPRLEVGHNTKMPGNR